jgi:hypothetical protein
MFNFKIMNLRAKIANCPIRPHISAAKILHFAELAYFCSKIYASGIVMKVLVITETDSCCGPMAAAFLNDFSESMEAVSMGRCPAQAVDALTVKAMRESLVDLSAYVPQGADTFELSSFDAVYECPDFPAPTTMEEARRIRDHIKNEAYLFLRRSLSPSKDRK